MANVQSKALATLKLASKLPRAQRVTLAAKMRELARAYERVSGEEDGADFWLDMANALDKLNAYNPFSANSTAPAAVKAPVDAAVQKVVDTADDVSLAVANKLDAVYNAVADRAGKVAEGLGDAAAAAGRSLYPLAAVALVLWLVVNKKGGR